MNLYLAAQLETEPTTYGWIITEDFDASAEDGSAVGVMGPGRAPDAIQEELQRRQDGKAARAGFHSATFDMYCDGDATEQDARMAHGRLVWTGNAEPDEEMLYSPVEEYGAAVWGCSRIRFPGHPGWGIS